MLEVAILTLFADFEKRRNDVLKMLEKSKFWIEQQSRVFTTTLRKINYSAVDAEGSIK